MKKIDPPTTPSATKRFQAVRQVGDGLAAEGRSFKKVMWAASGVESVKANHNMIRGMLSGLTARGREKARARRLAKSPGTFEDRVLATGLGIEGFRAQYNSYRIATWLALVALIVLAAGLYWAMRHHHFMHALQAFSAGTVALGLYVSMALKASALGRLKRVTWAEFKASPALWFPGSFEDHVIRDRLEVIARTRDTARP